MLNKIISLMQKKKKENDFKSYTLNIVYDSICEVLRICHKLPKNIIDCLREYIIKELKHYSNNKITENELIKNIIQYFIFKCLNSN